MSNLVFLEPNKIDATAEQIPIPMANVYVIEQKPNYCKVGVSTEYANLKPPWIKRNDNYGTISACVFVKGGQANVEI